MNNKKNAFIKPTGLRINFDVDQPNVTDEYFTTFLQSADVSRKVQEKVEEFTL